jgi:cytochrome c2
MTARVKEQKEKDLEDMRRWIALRKVPGPLQAEKEDKDAPKADPVEGRRLFTRKGCMACHQHAGTSQELKVEEKDDKGDGNKVITVPAAVSEATFGPDLSQLPAKLLTADKKNMDHARRWLVQWLLDPHVHSPRSKMPVTHLTKTEAANIAAWLLGQKAQDLGSGWDGVKVGKPEEETLRNLTKVYLDRILSRGEVKKFFDGDLPADRIKELPADERALAERLLPAALEKTRKDRNLDKRTEVFGQQLSWFVGKKAVGRLGCFGCHDVPGFDTAKNIGVDLNDWGKKDPHRLAFEDIAAYLKDKYHVVDSLVDEKGKPVHAHHGKAPYEKFFADALLHHTREGFLHQKVKDPRSYDYNRKPAWDDRSRMPQFKFAQLKPPHPPAAPEKGKEAKGKAGKKAAPVESHEDFLARAEVEEAAAREAVMTFVLGLVAEPIPLHYLNNPNPDRMAVVKGRQVLEKYNCNGCHLIQPGTYEFKRSKEVLAELDQFYKDNIQKTLNEEYPFTNHLAWRGRPQTAPDRFKVFAARPALTAKGFGFRLTEGLHYQARVEVKNGKAGKKEYDEVRDIPAGNGLVIPVGDMIHPPPHTLGSPEQMRAYEKRAGVYGGAYSEVLALYLTKEDEKKYGESSNLDKAMQFGPPSLIYQGERTQPDWLFRFLLKPHKVRELTVLRMPRFNMSEEEARALVNFFAAVDKLNNPRENLDYPYFNIPQRTELSDDFWKNRTREFLSRLKTTADPGNNKRTLYEKELEDLEPQWKAVRDDLEAQAKKVKENVERHEKPFKEFNSKALKAGKELAKAEKALEAEKEADMPDPAKIKTLTEQVAKAKVDKDAADRDLKPFLERYEAWSSENDRLTELLKESTKEKQKERWETFEAYPTAAFRLTVKVCASCHQLAQLVPNNEIKGPSLNLARDRLRPDWTQKWIGNPSRLVPYISIMPQNFPAHKPYFPDLFEGTSLQQITAIRDVLMNYTQVSDLPVNRHWGVTRGTEKTGEK